jgi:hypothetical protein
MARTQPSIAYKFFAPAYAARLHRWRAGAIYQIESSVQADTEGPHRTASLCRHARRVGNRRWQVLTPDDIHPIFGNAPTLTTSVLSTAALWRRDRTRKRRFDARSATRSGTIADKQWLTEVRYSARLVPTLTRRRRSGDSRSELRHAHVLGWAASTANSPIDFGVAFEHNYRVRGAADTTMHFDQRRYDWARPAAC